jgi:alkyl hydroperoxide reductase subunit AhpC
MGVSSLQGELVLTVGDKWKIVEFADRDAQILGFSGDSEFVHHAWRKDHDDLRDLPFPMLAGE